ncbi:MAG TPA: DEAD/DEAH box helicase [Bacteroidales bacterium]|nr:DEAD/DEAH box helicase [Bacteroidales bacterium]HQP03128.1 DEAD/DEAH box helicase [Bacteroidales bacterium]
MKTFEELGIQPDIIKGIKDCGFEMPLPVQEEVIPLLLHETRDVLALAQTGTGKTAAFGLPIIQNTKIEIYKPQTLILSPTRELCLQITDDLKDYAKYIDGIKILAVYGGSSIETQIKALHQGVHIVVATPGRLIDLIERKVVNLKEVKRIILDEADEMLNMGFLESIDKILENLPKGINSLLFSATMPPEIARIANKYMNNPVEITIGVRNTGLENIRHFNYTVQAKDKYLALKRIVDYYPDIYGIIFCRTRRETQEVADKLMADGYNAESLHGDLSQAQRDTVMQKFRIRNVRILVATDVAARGIDVNNLTHVINYNLPDDKDAYTHRSGRTGRVGKAGISVVLTNLREKSQIRLIEKNSGIQFIQAKVPNGKEVCEKQLYHLIDRIEKVEIEHAEIEPYLPAVYRKLEWLDKEELIKRLVSVEFNRFLLYYKNTKDLNLNEEKYQNSGANQGAEKRVKKDIPDNRDFQRKAYTKMFIGLGRNDGLYPNLLIDLLRKEVNGVKLNIGKIDLFNKYSIFELDSNVVEMVIEAFSDIYLEDRKIIVKIDTEKPSLKPGDFNKGEARSDTRFKPKYKKR